MIYTVDTLEQRLLVKSLYTYMIDTSTMCRMCLYNNIR